MLPTMRIHFAGNVVEQLDTSQQQDVYNELNATLEAYPEHDASPAMGNFYAKIGRDQQRYYWNAE